MSPVNQPSASGGASQQTGQTGTSDTTTTARPPKYSQVLERSLGWQGSLTGGADLIWVGTAAATTFLWNKAQRYSDRDLLWIFGELLIGGFVGLSVAEAGRKAASLRNICIGVTTAGLLSLVDRIIPDAKAARVLRFVRVPSAQEGYTLQGVEIQRRRQSLVA